MTEVHWRIIANLGFKLRSKFTAHCACSPHCGRGACREEGRGHLALCWPVLGSLVLCQRAGGRRSDELHDGFLLKDIASLIEQDCARDCQDGGVGVAGSHVVVDTARRYQLVYRYSYMMHSLRPFGYDSSFHPHFSARLVILEKAASPECYVGIRIVFGNWYTPSTDVSIYLTWYKVYTELPKSER